MSKNIRQKIGKSTLSTISAMDIDPDLLEEMEANPLSYNPFFASNMANRFEGDGKEGIDSGMLSLLRRKWIVAFPPPKKEMTNLFSLFSSFKIPAFSGYICKMLGNLECEDFEPQCEGAGVIDCTGSCPGGRIRKVDLVRFHTLMSYF